VFALDFEIGQLLLDPPVSVSCKANAKEISLLQQRSIKSSIYIAIAERVKVNVP